MNLNGWEKFNAGIEFHEMEMNDELRNYLAFTVKELKKNGFLRYENFGTTAVFKRERFQNNLKKESLCIVGTQVIDGKEFSVFEYYVRETPQIGYVKEVSPYYSVTLSKRGTWYSGD